jgi:hypothetical protein
LIRIGYPQVLIHYVGPLPVVVCALPDATAEDISDDLRELSESDCAARGIRHSSEDDNSTAILDTDPDWLTRGMLGAAARKTLQK